MDFVILVVVCLPLCLWNSITVFKNIIFSNKQYYILLLSINNHCVMKAPNRKKKTRCMRFYFIRIRVSYHSSGDDLYQQPFCIMYPIMHRCCHDNISPFRVWRTRRALCNSREGIRSAERRCFFTENISRSFSFSRRLSYRAPMRVTWLLLMNFTSVGPG